MTREGHAAGELRLEKPLLGQGGAGFPDDEVIEHPNADETQGVPQALRESPIALTGLAETTWMVMEQQAGARIGTKCLLDDFAGVDRRPVQGTAEQLVNGEDPVSVVEPDYPEDLVLEGAQAQLEIALRQIRRGQRLRVLDAPHPTLEDGHRLADEHVFIRAGAVDRDGASRNEVQRGCGWCIAHDLLQKAGEDAWPPEGVDTLPRG